ncbi:hypothetical protein [Geobacter sp. SVR]|uniref:hypothetical protein n=1 Tax=Geobacter sp. SVR TaxID=2495594 RepID=UPI00143F01B3|nr:hypothetical protein [Geobacter sp. SVR]BCS53405.1 hypothetical protein GSVR_17130 [Geobacter sp. SVR]GCF85469.1 hypothetical protein GSbR_20690 [Geobacter sp. SVR]
MHRDSHEATRSEPNEEECRTEQLVPRFSHCLKRNSRCVYAVVSGSFYYCMHPNHLGFKHTSVITDFPYE